MKYQNKPVHQIFRALLAIIPLFALGTGANGQVKSVEVGARFQKTAGLYYENGLTGQYHLTRRWMIGATYITSRFGSAMGSNAIKQDNFLLSGGYHFRPSRSLKPFIRFNTGYFTADYESDVFKDLPHTSLIASADAGLAYSFNIPLRINFSLGYNAITGDGERGAGTLYPVFYQVSTLWNLARPHK